MPPYTLKKKTYNHKNNPLQLQPIKDYIIIQNQLFVY